MEPFQIPDAQELPEYNQPLVAVASGVALAATQGIYSEALAMYAVHTAQMFD